MKKQKNRVMTHAEVSENTIWALTNKEKIQSEINAGKPINRFAESRKVHPESLRNIFRSVGIICGREKTAQPNRNQKLLEQVDAVTTVVLRIAKALEVAHDEIL